MGWANQERLWRIDVVRLGGLQAMLQATVGIGLSFDPLSFGQDSRTAPAIDVGGDEIVDAFVVSAVVVVVDEGGNLRFEIAGQEVNFQKDAVFEGLMPALDFAPRRCLMLRLSSHLARSPAM
jgi:hypothetical protein